MTHKHPFMIGSEWREALHTLPVTNPYSQEVFAEVGLAGAAEIDSAIEVAVRAFEKTRVLPTYLRSRICSQIAQGIEDRSEEFSKTISRESGKPLVFARAEMARSVSTFRVDNMPYGGVQDSGFGREGLKYSIEEMTEIKLLVMNNYLD